MRRRCFPSRVQAASDSLRSVTESRAAGKQSAHTPADVAGLLSGTLGEEASSSSSSSSSFGPRRGMSEVRQFLERVEKEPHTQKRQQKKHSIILDGGGKDFNTRGNEFPAVVERLGARSSGLHSLAEEETKCRLTVLQATSENMTLTIIFSSWKNTK